MFMRQISASVIAAGVFTAMPAWSQDADQLDRLYGALQFDQIVSIIRQEGLTYGAQIGEDMFPTRAGDSWTQTVSAIYDEDAMQAQVRRAFDASLAGDDVDAMLAFIDSDLGQRSVTLEVSARRAMLDKTVEDAANEAAKLAAADNTDRYQQLKEFIDVNGLIESNVSGGLNTNFAFYSGLMAGGAFEDMLTEQQILSDVYDQEPQIRDSTTQWITSFLLLAYDPLSDDDIAQYTAFSQTQAGRDLNTTLFASFDGVFEGISFALGREAAMFMTTQDL